MNPIAIDTIRRSRRYALVASAAILALIGVTGSPAGTAQQSVPKKQTSEHQWFQLGRASWYGRFFQGRATADGESFDMNDLTCAHRSLPMGSFVKVTNLSNNKTVVVRVNDRGPITRSRVIDLSYAAAQFLGFGGNGTARVRLELTDEDPRLAQIVFPQNFSILFSLTPSLVR